MPRPASIRLTGLRWQRSRAPQEMNWQDATTYCAGLSLAGERRLPPSQRQRPAHARGRMPRHDDGAAPVPRRGSHLSLAPGAASMRPAVAATAGRGADGRYWEQGVWQGGGTVFRSSSRDIIAWTVGFLQRASTGPGPAPSSHGVRCVTGDRDPCPCSTTDRQRGLPVTTHSTRKWNPPRSSPRLPLIRALLAGCTSENPQPSPPPAVPGSRRRPSAPSASTAGAHHACTSGNRRRARAPRPASSNRKPWRRHGSPRTRAASR